jgi:hypothetical protein
MLRPVIISTLIAAGLCSAAHADVYRWVDEKGTPHYTDRWVPGSELIKSDKPHPQMPNSAPSVPTPSATAAASQRASSQLSEHANEEAVKQDVAKTRDAQCKQAKDVYQKAIESRRIYKPGKDGDGDRVYMSDAETDQYRAQARSQVIEACGSAPPPAQP